MFTRRSRNLLKKQDQKHLISPQQSSEHQRTRQELLRNPEQKRQQAPQYETLCERQEARLIEI